MLRLRLRGGLAAELDGVPLGLPTSERACALVGWLALHRGRHPRSEVAAQLWPDAPPERARANLRTAVWAVHQAWPAAARHIEATRSTVGLVGDDIWVDTRDGLDDLDLQAAGELLPGFDDDWADSARTEYRDHVLRHLVDQGESAERAGDVVTAVRLAHRVCRLVPLDEGAHRTLLRRLLLVGDRASAAVAAREFTDRLRRELGVSPSPPTRAAQAEIRGGPAPPSRTRLFGRAVEVTRLATIWAAAARGAGQVVVVTGEAGIGKSCLVGELVHRVTTAGGRPAVGVGMDVAGQTPFAAWLELCTSLVGSVAPVGAGATWPVELNRLSDGLGARLGHPGTPPSVAAPELERLRVFESVLRLVEWSCADRPTMLALDDAHRADRASLRLTAHVGRRIARLPLLLVLTRRDGAPGPQLDAMVADLIGRGVPVTQIALGPIADREVAALATSLHALDADRLRRVVSAAEGNPLLAVESARAVAAGGVGPPPNLRTAVRAAAGRLPAEAVRLLGLLAVAGRPLTSSELDGLGVQDVVAAEEAAAAEGLLVRRGGRLGFRHELLREAVHADLPDPARLHDRIASALDPGDHAAVAHHLALAGRESAAAGRWAAAAAHARALGALTEAADFLDRATALSPLDGRLWLELEEVLAWLGRRTEMEAAWDRALELLPDADLASAWCRRGLQLRTVVCRPSASLRAYERAAEFLDEVADVDLRASILTGLAWGDAVAGGGRRFEELLGAAERLLPPSPNATLRADLAEVRMQGLIRQGRFAEAVAIVLGAAPHAVSARLPDRAFAVWTNAACALTCAGDYEGALAMADRAVEGTRAVPVLLVGGLAMRAQVLARLGRHEEAAEAVGRQREVAERLDAPVLAATAMHDAGLVALAGGRPGEAADLLRRALAAGAAVSRPTTALRCAEALALSGDPDGATRQLRSAVLEPVGPADQPWSLVPRVAFVQGLIAAARRDPDQARRRFDESAAAWHRVTGDAAAAKAEGFLATLVDLGRPPVVGLVEPERELARIDDARRALGRATSVGQPVLSAGDPGMR